MQASDSTEARRVILCDESGTPTGTAGLIAAHEADGQLHKAFSVFVFRSLGKELELLIQQRSAQKPLFGHRWANTCCSHLSPGDTDICEAGQARLAEECGFAVPLRVAGSFVYRALDSRAGGAEYEHDTVLLGQATADVRVDVDPAEIKDWKWATPDELQRALQQDADNYAPWFGPALRIALADLSDMS